MNLAWRLLWTDDEGLDEAAARLLDRRAAMILLAAAFVTRAVSAAAASIVAPDGVRYIEAARLFSQGRFREGLSDNFHPLYPLLIAVFKPVCGGFESAAFCVPMVFSSFAVLFLFWTLRPSFGRAPALAACTLFAVLPHFVRAGSDTISEGLFHFFAIFAFWAGARAFREGKAVPAVLGGMSAGAAYLTRPEGILVLGAFGVHTVVCIVAKPLEGSRLKAAVIGLVFLGGFVCMGSPYLGYIRDETGKWDISRKKTLDNFSKTLEDKVEQENEVPNPEVRVMGTPEAVAVFLGRLLSNFYYVPGILVLLGLLIPSRAGARDWRTEALLVTGALLWAAACVMLLRSNGYLSHRHSMPAALLLLGHSGCGAVVLAKRLGALIDGIPRWKALSRGVPAGTFIFAFLLAFASGVGLAVDFRPSRADKSFVKDIGRELAQSEGTGRVFTGNMSRVAFYADCRHLPLPAYADVRAVLEIAGSEGAAVLVYEDKPLSVWAPNLHKALSDPRNPPAGLVHIRTWTAGRNSEKLVHAYRIVAAAKGP